jgi:hypothetical protein
MRLSGEQERAWRAHLQTTVEWVAENLSPEEVYSIEELVHYFTEKNQEELQRLQQGVRDLEWQVYTLQRNMRDLEARLEARCTPAAPVGEPGKLQLVK